MKYIYILIILFLSASSVLAQNTAILSVSISNITLNNSSIFVGIYDSNASFKAKSGAVDSLIFIPEKETVEVSFESIPYGNYAVAVFQDINNNGILDSEKFNIPSEPVGISNYPINKSKLPPTFKKAIFSLSGDTLISIPMIFENEYPDKK